MLVVAVVVDEPPTAVDAVEAAEEVGGGDVNPSNMEDKALRLCDCF